jgi:hypothetical protein
MTKDFPQMNSAVADVATLNGMARSLERSEARRIGTTLTQARKTVARRLGVTPSTFDNYLYGRVKVVPNWLMGKVRAELISVLQSEAAHLEHEIQLHRQTGSHHSEDALASAESQLAAAREILRGK